METTKQNEEKRFNKNFKSFRNENKENTQPKSQRNEHATFKPEEVDCWWIKNQKVSLAEFKAKLFEKRN